MCRSLVAGQERGRRHNIVIVAEGAQDRKGQPISSNYVKQVLEERLGVNARVTILGHVQRGGAPSSFDRMIAGRMGLVAVEALSEGKSGIGVVWQATIDGGESTSDPQLRTFPLEQILAETQAMMDGSSGVVGWRRERMEAIQGVLAL